MRCSITYRDGDDFSSRDFTVADQTDPIVLRVLAALRDTGAEILLIRFIEEPEPWTPRPPLSLLGSAFSARSPSH